MKIEELREIFSEDGLYTVCAESGGITYAASVPDDYIALSVEAFTKCLERLGFKVVRGQVIICEPA